MVLNQSSSINNGEISGGLFGQIKGHVVAGPRRRDNATWDGRTWRLQELCLPGPTAEGHLDFSQTESIGSVCGRCWHVPLGDDF